MTYPTRLPPACRPDRRAFAACTTLLACFCLAHGTRAAPPPAPPPASPGYSISDAVRDAAPPRDLPAARAAPLPEVVDEFAAAAETDGPTIQVTDIRVEGAAILDPEDLEPVLRRYRNRALTIGEINEAANRLTVLCRTQGFLVARAYVPKQEMQGGVLVIRVVAGKYGRFTVENHSRVRESVIASLLNDAASGEGVVTRESLERSMLLVNDLPGAGMPDVSIRAGRDVGTSDFAVKVPGGPAVTGYAIADNYGSRFTGRDRLAAGLDVTSPLGFGDKLSLGGLTTSQAGLQNGRLAYAVPLNADGLRGELAAWRTTYKLGAAYASLDATGVADALEASIAYPLRRTRTDNLSVTFGLADKFLRDEIAKPASVTDKRARLATFTLQEQWSGRLAGAPASGGAMLGATTGTLSFANAAQRLANRLGADTVGNYRKVNLSGALHVEIVPGWTLGGTLTAQHSLDRNLDGSEQLSVSGATGIRAYPDGVVSDNGVLLGLDARRALPAIGTWQHALGPFADYGQVSPQHGAYTTVQRVSVSDAGIAYHAARGVAFLQLEVARTTGNARETTAYNHAWKLLAELGARF